MLLRVTDRGGAALARRCRARTAKRSTAPATALQVALSGAGLRALGVPSDREGFSDEFIAGMASDENRARRLGDVARTTRLGLGRGSAYRSAGDALCTARPSGRVRSVEAQCAAGFEQIGCLSTGDMDGVEPFGFVDGISQPTSIGTATATRRTPSASTTPICGALGEYLLGYPNEYGG